MPDFLRKKAATALGMKYLFAALLVGLAAAISFPSRAAEKARQPALGESPAVQEFIGEMQARHRFDAAHLARLFASIRANPTVLRAIRPAAVPELQRSWQRYRVRFLNEQRLTQGLRFWREHHIALVRAEAIYGVPQEIVTAIIGVETEYGRNTGKFGVLEALATLAFEYPPRASFFRSELEQFLLLARESGIPPQNYKGSYAGAIGIPQFMPSSLRNYAADFDGDGRIDLSRSAGDAIGSVARFLNVHGWRPDGPVAVPASASGDVAALVAAGIKPSIPLREMRKRGVSPLFPEEAARFADAPAALIDLVTPGQPTEYWFGFANFYVITRYNRSSFYAMSVFQLAEALRRARDEKTQGTAP
ncbi:MAG: lytic murein transglycosylase B [Candidatus Accumulibacter sp.]|jgi:membrane-bound lytic murein transglycosylase B|nr:lytic murein transglycosylase B [Accumulibacter sp.]